MNRTTIQKRSKGFSEAEQHQIIREFLSGHCTKQEVWQKHTGQADEHGHLLRWMRRLGYGVPVKKVKGNIAPNHSVMPINNVEPEPTAGPEEPLESFQMKKKIRELERQLEEAELKAVAFSTMVDIAEKEFRIPIRKKSNTKP